VQQTRYFAAKLQTLSEVCCLLEFDALHFCVKLQILRRDIESPFKTLKCKLKILLGETVDYLASEI
jgi:hypothetical protein